MVKCRGKSQRLEIELRACESNSFFQGQEFTIVTFLMLLLKYILGHLADAKATCSNSYIHILMTVSAMQGANQYIRSSFGV